MTRSRYFSARYWLALFFGAAEALAAIFVCVMDSARAATIDDSARSAGTGDAARVCRLADSVRRVSVSDRGGAACTLSDSTVACP